MSEIQIYYLCPKQIQSSLDKSGIDLSSSFRQGDKSIEELKAEIKTNPKFCRNEQSIRYDHFVQLLFNDIILYAQIDGKVVGALEFMFNIENGEKVIIFDGICSPIEYSKLGVGQELINALIRIGKMNGHKYIMLECNGSIMNYYKNKFGFKVTSQHVAYDSDADSDDSDDEGEIYYNMKLDLSTVSGGRKNRKNRRTFKRGKIRNLTRKRKNNKRH
jgi:hypothetical protein